LEYERIERGVIWFAGVVVLYLVGVAFNLGTDDIINASLMAMLCIGFTFTYMVEGFPNLAHTSYAIIGAVVSFYLTRFHRFNPYDTWPFSLLIGGLFGVFIYMGIIRPIKRHGGYQEVVLTFSSLAIATVLGGLSWVFSYWSARGRAPTQAYNLSGMDFYLNGRPGIVYVGLGTSIMVVVSMYVFLTRTRTGISLRATAENEGLAEVMGINSFRVHCVSWFISGGLASLAGSVFVINQGMTPTDADALLVSVMTGSILGGLDSINGAIVGGVFVAISQKVLSTVLFWIFGLDVLRWTGIYPIVFLIIALFFFPNGVLNGTDVDLKWLRRRMAKLRKTVP
jgi:branched-chain amino acid transport system permease protein